ncbi:MAG: hypothetical protein P8I38_06440 [Arenicella sp.]|jgi:multimeric flavodoxin WrbA|nr:hypothetical protein [Arenicella sp.]
MNDKLKSLLIVGHAPSPNAKALVDALLNGAQSDDIEAVHTKLLSPFECDAQDVLAADAIILFTTENFGYMNGALKDFFERIYYPCLQDLKRNEAKPYSLVVRAGLDGTGATESVQRIITGLKWREALPRLLCKGEHDLEFVTLCFEHGFTMAASLDNGII